MDTKYLYKRNNVWWVKLAVPSALRSKLGYDLRKSTGQSDVEKAVSKHPNISKYLEGNEIKKVIFIKDKLINFVNG